MTVIPFTKLARFHKTSPQIPRNVSFPTDWNNSSNSNNSSDLNNFLFDSSPSCYSVNSTWVKFWMEETSSFDPWPLTHLPSILLLFHFFILLFGFRKYLLFFVGLTRIHLFEKDEKNASRFFQDFFKPTLFIYFCVDIFSLILSLEFLQMFFYSPSELELKELEESSSAYIC